MKKNIWVVSNNKHDLLNVQNKIDRDGGMKTICLLSYDAILNAFDRMEKTDIRPTVLIIDYDMGKEEEFKCLKLIMQNKAFTGIPLFFITSSRSEEIDEECYELGANIIFKKPLNDTSIKRIERMAWQQEMTRNYEAILYRQAAEIQTAKEIRRLNEMLESRNKVLRQVFGKYFSENVVDVILENENGASLGGEKKEATVIMADLRGFTSLSDNLSADVVVDMIDIYLEGMTKIISKYQGTIIEFIGDAVLAIFSEPYCTEKLEIAAIKAAIEMQNSMDEINKINESKGYPAIDMGIGIHKGEVFLGNIGSEYMMRYNVIGQAVNICSRIQSYSLGGQILVSSGTISDIEENVEIGSSFSITVKGVRGNIDVSEIVSIVNENEIMTLNNRINEVQERLEDPVPCLIFEIQDKRVNTYAIHGNVVACGDKSIIFSSSSNEMKELADHIDVEIVVKGRNAYGKVIGINGNEIQIVFTYKSKDFEL